MYFQAPPLNKVCREFVFLSHLCPMWRPFHRSSSVPLTHCLNIAFTFPRNSLSEFNSILRLGKLLDTVCSQDCCQTSQRSIPLWMKSLLCFCHTPDAVLGLEVIAWTKPQMLNVLMELQIHPRVQSQLPFLPTASSEDMSLVKAHSCFPHQPIQTITIFLKFINISSL